MYSIDLCFVIPTAIVWLIGLVVAIVRWKQHPGVSTAVAVGMGCMLIAVATYYFAAFSLLASPTRSAMIGFGVVAVIVSLLRGGGWAAVLAAAFGWRDPAGAGRRIVWQFSIRNLLVVTLAVAVLCAAARGLVDLLGESAVFLLDLVDELPVFICWFFGAWLAWTRRNHHPQVARRVAIAIGLDFLHQLLGLATFAAIVVNRSPEFGLFPNLCMSVLIGPAKWTLLLTAAFGWRTVDESFQPAPEQKPFAALP